MIEKEQEKRKRDLTCLVEVLMTAAFPFLCASRSMCPPSSSSWSPGVMSNNWEATDYRVIQNDHTT